MTIEEQEKLLDEIRERRMRVQREYDAAQALRQQVSAERTRARLDRVIALFDKEMKKLDKIDERCHELINRIRVIKLEARVE